MTSLLIVKQTIKKLYSKYEIYFVPLLKLIFMLISLSLINHNLGYMTRLNSMPIVLIAALMCSFMPMNFMVIVAAAFVMLHIYQLSLECAVVVGVLFLLMFLLYFRFSPKDTIAVLLTPICFVCHVPYVMPIAMGLLGTPASAVSVGCGVIVYYVVSYVTGSASAITALADEEATAQIKYLLDGILKNREMVVVVAAFAITIMLVYLIRRLSIDYSWIIAIAAGVLADVMILLVGDLMFDTNVSVGGIIVGAFVAALVGLVLMFLFFQVDYTRVEKVQFEDDEYYYYVKAVPKITVSTPQKKVKKINSHKREKK